MENSSNSEVKSEINFKILIILYFISVALSSYYQYLPSDSLLKIVLIIGLLNIILPISHIAIFSIFKSKRTSKVRKRILKGWFIFLIISSIVNLYDKYKDNFSDVNITDSEIKEVNTMLEKASGTKLTSDITIKSIYMIHLETRLKVNYYVYLDGKSINYSKESLTEVIDKENACFKFLPLLEFDNVNSIRLFIAYRFNDNKVIDMHVDCI